MIHHLALQRCLKVSAEEDKHKPLQAQCQVGLQQAVSTGHLSCSSVGHFGSEHTQTSLVSLSQNKDLGSIKETSIPVTALQCPALSSRPSSAVTAGEHLPRAPSTDTPPSHTPVQHQDILSRATTSTQQVLYARSRMRSHSPLPGIPVAYPHLTFTAPFTLLQLQLLPGPHPIHRQLSNIFFEGRINLTGFIKVLPQESVHFCQILTPWKERETAMRSLNNSSPATLSFSSSLNTDFVV